MSEPFFEVETDYHVPLLKVLADLPEGAPKREVLALFWERYQEHIPPDHLQPVASHPRELIWENKVAWARNRLKDIGFIDASEYGLWRLSNTGRDWVANNPNATVRVSGKPVTATRSARTRKRQSAPSASKPPAYGLTFEMLEQTRKAMPLEQFRQVWGLVYDQLQAEERAKALTPFSDKQLLQAVRQPVRRIHAFLQGRGNDSPKSEEICDWIHFCYALELYREAAALWQYVNQDEVHAWQYERTKKIAMVCRTKI